MFLYYYIIFFCFVIILSPICQQLLAVLFFSQIVRYLSPSVCGNNN